MYLNDEELDYDPFEDVTEYVSDHTGGKVKTTYHNNGHSTVHHGGPCGDSEYDEYGEEC